MDKENRKHKERQEDAALNRALLWILAAVVLEGLLILVNRFFVNFYTDEVNIALFIRGAVRVGCVLFLVVAVLGFVWAYRWKKREKPTLLPGCVAFFSLMLWCFCLILQLFYDSGVTLLFVAIPVVAVLALVYYLYQRECFAAVWLTVMGVFGMWMMRRGSAGPYLNLIRAYFIVMAVVSAALLVLLVVLHQKSGVLEIRGKSIKVLGKRANYPLLLATCVIMLLAFIAGVVLAPTVLYYLIFVLIAWAIILIVYYTVQML